MRLTRASLSLQAKMVNECRVKAGPLLWTLPTKVCKFFPLSQPPCLLSKKLLPDEKMIVLQHYKIAGEEAQSRAELEDDIAVTFTATMSAYGSLLLGSSREFSGFSSSPSMAVQHAILARARTYLPALDNLQSPNTQVRCLPPLKLDQERPP